MSKVRPQLYRVIVKVKEVEKMSAGGIEIPEEARKREDVGSTEGIIASIGPTAFEMLQVDDMRPKVGDHVIFARHSGSIFNRDEGEFRVLNDEDILAVEEFGDGEEVTTTRKL